MFLLKYFGILTCALLQMESEGATNTSSLVKSSAEMTKVQEYWSPGDKITITIGMLLPQSNDTEFKQQIGYGTSASALTIAIETIQKEQLLPTVQFK